MSDDELFQAILTAGVVDTHYHVGPELVDRRYDVATLAEAAGRCGMTLVLKNHTYPTTPWQSRRASGPQPGHPGHPGPLPRADGREQ